MRTEGATCATTRIFLSSMASHTTVTFDRKESADVGQTAAHCPHPTQSVSLSFLWNGGVTCVFEPRNAKSIAPTPCISSQVRTQSPHRMHLFGSNTMLGELMSIGRFSFVFGKRTSCTPTLYARDCNSHMPFLWQIVQSLSWDARSNSIINFR